MNTMNKKRTVFLKCILTGLIYAFVTCIVQVPVANVLFSILDIQSDASIPDGMLPILLFSIFIVGVAMTLFYYLNGHLFASTSKWKQGMKFAAFVYLSNYIPQVFFLDANKGISALITGGFPIIQVELFDLIILAVTVLLMVRYMPCRYHREKNTKKIIWWKCLVCGVVFAMCLFLLQEFILPLVGFSNMASGLVVSNENIPFFYSVMITGFIVTGFLVSCYVYRINDVRRRKAIFVEYGVLIWCTFDLTMIPLGYGILATILFIITSLIAFIVIRYVYGFLYRY